MTKFGWTKRVDATEFTYLCWQSLDANCVPPGWDMNEGMFITRTVCLYREGELKLSNGLYKWLDEACEGVFYIEMIDRDKLDRLNHLTYKIFFQKREDAERLDYIGDDPMARKLAWG